MVPEDLASAEVVRLPAEDIRRLPMLGIAIGFAATAVVLTVVESGGFNRFVVAALWVAVLLVVLAILPAANALTLTPAGFRVRVLGVFTRFVPWSEVIAVEAGEGWAEAAVAVRLTETADRGIILGLPRDPTLGVRSFVDHYGRDPEELAGEMERRRRAAAHP